MPDITEHPSSSVTKMLLIGDSGAGKTGALASLAQAGYNLRILDLDNGMDILRNMVTGPGSKYTAGAQPGRIIYLTLTEQMKQIQGNLVPTKASVWPETVRMLDRWVEYQTDDTGKTIIDPATKKGIVRRDLGPIASWSDQDILVIDSLTMLSSAALNYDAMMNAKLGLPMTQNEYRRAIGRAQDLMEKLLKYLYDDHIRCNVILTSHITYVKDIGGAMAMPMDDDDKGEGSLGPQVGYPSAIGRSLSPRIPRYFNSVLYMRTSGSGSAARHMIHTTTQGVVNVKSSAPLNVKAQYPIETGLADYFRDLRKGIVPGKGAIV